MVLLEIREVAVAELATTLLRGRSIDLPQPGSVVEGAALDIAGWVLGQDTPALAVELVHAGRVARRVPVGVRRPDVAAAFPTVAAAELSGFQTALPVLGPAAELELEVRAVL